MKHFSKVLFVVLAFVCFTGANAQDKDNRWVIELGTNVVDFYPTGTDTDFPDTELPIQPIPEPLSDDASATGGMFEDFFETDHWNTGSVISRFRLGYYVGSGFSVGGTFTFNSITQVGDFKVASASYFGTDLDIKYAFVRDSWFDPYLFAG
jgi:hypothetical protein